MTSEVEEVAYPEAADYEYHDGLETVIGKVASQAGQVLRHAAIGAKVLVKDSMADAAATVDAVMHDVGIRPEPSEAEIYRTNFEAFQDTIIAPARLSRIIEQLNHQPDDFSFETITACERHVYGKVRDTIGFTDGIHWLNEAAKEKNPGPHVDEEDWIADRIADYTEMLCKAGMRPDTSQLLSMGLTVHCRELQKRGEWINDGKTHLPLSVSGDVMRC